MSLGKSLDEKNIYPLFITLNEPLIESKDHNSIDLFCLYELKYEEKYLDKLKSSLDAIILGLNSNDRLGLISFTNVESTQSLQFDKELAYMNETNKKEFISIIKQLSIDIKNKSMQKPYDFDSGIVKCKNKIKKIIFNFIRFHIKEIKVIKILIMIF